MTADTEVEVVELRRLLREESVKVVALRAALAELIERRRSVADEYRSLGLVGADPALVLADGTDGRYARAREVWAANAPLNHGERQARTDDLVPTGGG